MISNYLFVNSTLNEKFHVDPYFVPDPSFESTLSPLTSSTNSTSISHHSSLPIPQSNTSTNITSSFSSNTHSNTNTTSNSISSLPLPPPPSSSDSYPPLQSSYSQKISQQQSNNDYSEFERKKYSSEKKLDKWDLAFAQPRRPIITQPPIDRLPIQNSSSHSHSNSNSNTLNSNEKKAQKKAKKLEKSKKSQTNTTGRANAFSILDSDDDDNGNRIDSDED